jgi:hypothetical protein
MYSAVFTVTLRLPDTMTPAEARANLKTSIGFGNPEISHPYVIADPDYALEHEPLDARQDLHVVAIEDVQTGSEAF